MTLNLTRRISVWLVAFSIIVVILLVGWLGVLWITTSDAESLVRALRNVAKDGCHIQEITSVVGMPDSTLAADDAPQWLREAVQTKYPVNGVVATDQFMVYGRKHGRGRSIEIFLQVRKNRLINVNPEDFQEPDESFANISTLR